MFNAIEVASLFGTLELRDTATTSLQQFDSSLERTAQNMQRIGGQMQGLGLAITGAIAPLVAFGVQGVHVAADFDSAMVQISARTGVVGADLEQVRQLALQMGADTVFSAQDAANAMLELLASGQSVTEMMATLPAVLTAAAASGEDLGTTADNITNILAAFGLEADQAGAVVDALSRAAGASSADMSSLGQGFANVGGVAAQFGLTFEDTAAILAIFAENGIKGAEAGTQLRSMLLNMSRDTDQVRAAWAAFGSSMYDAQGNIRPIADVLADISRASASMTSEQRQRAMTDLAGSYGILGLTALTSSIDIDAMLEAMGESADAASVARARMNTFEGAMDSLGGSVETLMITVFTPFMNDVLKPLVQQVTEVINSFTEWAGANPDIARTVIEVVIAVAGLGVGLLALGTFINIAGTALGGLALLLSPAGVLIAGVVAVAAAFATNFGGIRDLVESVVGDLEVNFALIAFTAEYYLGWVWARIRPMWEELRDWFSGDLVPALTDVFVNHVMPLVQDFQDFLIDLWSIVYPHLQDLYDWFVTEGLPGILNFISGTVIPGIGGFIDLVKGIWDAVSPALLEFANWFLNTALPDIVRFINTNVMPIVNDFINLVGTIWNAVRPELEQFVNWFTTTGLPRAIAMIDDAAEAAGRLIEIFNALTGGPFSSTRTPMSGYAPGYGTLDGATFDKPFVAGGYSDLGTGTLFENRGTGKANFPVKTTSIGTININGDQSGRTAADYKRMFIQVLEEIADGA